MRLSELQNKDVVYLETGKVIGKIIDVIISEDGAIISLIVEKYKFLISLFTSRAEIEIPWCNISKMGEDVILVSLI